MGRINLVKKKCPTLNSTSCFCPGPLTEPVVLLTIKNLVQPTDFNPPPPYILRQLGIVVHRIFSLI